MGVAGCAPPPRARAPANLAAPAAAADAPATAAAADAPAETRIEHEGGYYTEDPSGRVMASEMEMAEGKLSYRADKPITETDLGIPLYPGATQVSSNVMSSQNKQGDTRVIIGNFTTADGVETVRAFFAARLKGAQVTDSAYATDFVISRPRESMVRVIIRPAETGGASITVNATLNQAP